MGFEEVHIVAQPPTAAGGGARRILKWARSGVLVAGSQVVKHGYSETQKTIGECQIVSEEKRTDDPRTRLGTETCVDAA